MLRVALLVSLALAGCGEKAAPTSDSVATRVAPDLRRPDTRATSGTVSVRIGEAGPAFRACTSAGTPRGADPLVVRAGPFDSAAIVGNVATGARVFVCTRSIDQRWMGIVYDPSGALSPACGVSAPVPRRANYAGACRSGWVNSASVRSVAS